MIARIGINFSRASLRGAAAALLPLPFLLLAASASAQTMPLRHAVKDHVVQVGEGGIATLAVDPAFRYVGGQRFVLLGVADAEQHAFVVSNEAGNIQRFYWFQFEQYLPGSPGTYDYGQDRGLTLNGREWRAQVRRYSTPADPTSDRGYLYKLFAAAGLHAPSPATRTRMVYVTSPDRRAELMIIYAEASATDAPPLEAEIDAMIARAQAGLRIR
jgi:hypothetical protein